MDRQVRRMVTQRTGEDPNTVDSAEAAATTIASDSDEDKNDTVNIFSSQISYHYAIFKSSNF